MQELLVLTLEEKKELFGTGEHLLFLRPCIKEHTHNGDDDTNDNQKRDDVDHRVQGRSVGDTYTSCRCL